MPDNTRLDSISYAIFQAAFDGRSRPKNAAVGILKRLARCRRRLFAGALFGHRCRLRLRLQRLRSPLGVWLSRHRDVSFPKGLSSAAAFAREAVYSFSSASAFLEGRPPACESSDSATSGALAATLPADFFPLPCAGASGIPRASKKSAGSVLHCVAALWVRRASPAARDRCQAAIGAASSESAKR
jgi:hypothetical protein